jgi:hypothetical protein
MYVGKKALLRRKLMQSLIQYTQQISKCVDYNKEIIFAEITKEILQ